MAPSCCNSATPSNCVQMSVTRPSLRPSRIACPGDKDHPLRSFGLARPKALVGLVQYAHAVLVGQAAKLVSGEDWYRQPCALRLGAVLMADFRNLLDVKACGRDEAADRFLSRSLPDSTWRSIIWRPAIVVRGDCPHFA